MQVRPLALCGQVIVVSSAFDGVQLLQRHRMVNAALAAELADPGKIHALSLTTKTPEQWAKSGGSVHPTPPCQGGH